MAATAASTVPGLAACGGSPDSENAAEDEAQADTAAAASFEQS
jgi:hypothetical protein